MGGTTHSSTDPFPPLLDVSDVTRSFPGVRALSGMRLDLRHGEVLALVGENGAGKSTLMRLLSGVDQPDTGRFLLDGREIRPSGPGHARSLGIGIIHQEFSLVPDLTVAQNLFLGREPRRWRWFVDRRALDRRAAELVAELGLPLDPDAPVATLSVAHQQLVEIARALSHRPRVLIMDEPTAALDADEVETLHALIRRFQGPNTGVIYISHRMDEIRRVADRITVIRDGRYVATRAVSTTSTDEVVSLMVGRAVATSTAPAPTRVARRPGPVVLSVRGLSTRGLLRDVSFDLHEGEILGFAGLMGAGRTETARALVGADPSTGGTVEVRGRPARIRNPAEAAALGVGYLSEDRKRYGLLLDHDVGTNITLAALASRFATAGVVRRRAARTAAQGYVRALGVRTPSLDRPVRNLSGGNQQKVVLARWLARDCDVLIVDEPTRGVDVGAKEEIHQLLEGLANDGTSVIVISSELPEVLRLSDRVVVMSEGRVTGILPAAEASQEAIMRYATLRPENTGTPPPDRDAPGDQYRAGAPDPTAPEHGREARP
ncbi:D-xylose ABC transporter ATP-binding protein [Actinoalloteichus sp. AHMU CJ021]|uniref:sugar ABC transporter ATP-binding protein n=1 Tax=Actinoalloteichus TaxID=65496 RepID=UPI000CA001B4|nr:D-xylose ABC transporter ATP-binding protein [Actinoalloteichus sp. AHMU CJ021]